ncbi:hypothetical protein [Ralstonia pseudosolanacearum]|uniref:hypothetical protein n=1 Tax=Ralstonia pseudosolanacearum TaxID=1310165 RepID=UPI0012DA05F4|nr:hypothetical protein [Ralstonia pseudosolanacearum]
MKSMRGRVAYQRKMPGALFRARAIDFKCTTTASPWLNDYLLLTNGDISIPFARD